MIPYGRQEVTQDDIDAVVAVLRSDYITQGQQVPAFERAVARYANARYAVALNSATSALHCACMALEVGNGDRVWTSPITFVASANCALYCGATVDFVDIDPGTYNISVAALAQKLELAEAAGTLPKVVIVVHLAGQSCPVAAIHDLATRYGFRIIEDASHAIGARYRDEPVGNCRYSDIVVFSFHPVKIITTGEGGMALTNDAALAGRLSRGRSHGITSDPALMQPRPEPEIWNYQQIALGFNYRMTDFQAALGLSQLQRLDAFVARRNELALRYDQLLESLPLSRQQRHADALSSFHLYLIRLDLSAVKRTRRQVYDALLDQGIGVNIHYIPVYRQPYFEQFGFHAGYCPEAERYYAEVLTIPLYPGLSEAEQDQVVATLSTLLT